MQDGCASTAARQASETGNDLMQNYITRTALESQELISRFAAGESKEASDVKKKPLIILDLDLTVIGSVAILLDINKVHMKTNMSWIVNESQFIKFLEEGLLRPYFKEYIMKMKDNNIFAVYTLSNRMWANFVIAAIEKFIGIKFVEVLLVAEDAVVGRKSVGHVLDALEKKGVQVDMTDITIIDDNPTYTEEPLLQVKVVRVMGYKYVVCEFVKKMLADGVYARDPAFGEVLVSNIKKCLQAEAASATATATAVGGAEVSKPGCEIEIDSSKFVDYIDEITRINKKALAGDVLFHLGEPIGSS